MGGLSTGKGQGVGEEAVVVVGNREGGSVAEEGEGASGVESEDPDDALRKHPPSSAADVGLSGADSATPAPPVKEEVKQEPNGSGDSSSGASTQPDSVDATEKNGQWIDWSDARID